MLRSAKTAATAATIVASLMALAAFGACGDRQTQTFGESLPAVSSTGEPAAACGGDSLRPAAAAPARGLWLYSPSRERVAAMIGLPRPDDHALVVARRVETMEVSATGDTIRQRLDSATVSLEL